MSATVFPARRRSAGPSKPAVTRYLGVITSHVTNSGIQAAASKVSGSHRRSGTCQTSRSTAGFLELF
jgi:hypothetical protein